MCLDYKPVVFNVALPHPTPTQHASVCAHVFKGLTNCEDYLGAGDKKTWNKHIIYYLVRLKIRNI